MHRIVSAAVFSGRLCLILLCAAQFCARMMIMAKIVVACAFLLALACGATVLTSNERSLKPPTAADPIARVQKGLMTLALFGVPRRIFRRETETWSMSTRSEG